MMLAASGPLVLRGVWLLPLIMGLSFATILFFGKRMPKKGAGLGIAAVGFCFIYALIAAGTWIDRVNDFNDAAGATEEHALAVGGATEEEPVTDDHAGATDDHATDAEVPAGVEDHGEEEEHGGEAGHEEHVTVPPVTTSVTWFEIGGNEYTVGTLVDGLSVLMLVVVTLISLLVHVYSTEYVSGDRRYTHYFAFLSLFTGSMLMLVISSNTIQFITSWELVGLCSFALIGHWWEEKPNSDAALKAFITNRVGDVGLLVGMIVLFFAARGSFDILEINALASAGTIDHLLLLVASCSLIAAVMSKSGQFILHTWLPDAMAGPTPVSALIHAATMVVAGIFMVARFYGVFWEGLQIGDANINLLAAVGAVTVVGGAGLAFVQNDIKRVLAYSTVSQLGYMVMALGVGAWTAALFHLMTHAFFKAGLFLGSGSVAHAVHSFDMKKDMGGLKRFMPRTFWTFVICSVALAGIFPLAGFWSKDEILAGASGSNELSGYPVMFVMGLLGGLMTAAYMTRCVYLTFFGEPRGHAADAHHPPHEPGPRMLVPLYVLSALAVVAGLANLPFGGGGFELRFEHYVEPVGPYFPAIPHPEFTPWIAVLSVVLALAGFALAYAYWWRGALHGLTERFRLARAGHQVLVNRYYFDWLYTDVIVRAVKGPVARAMNWVNQRIIDAVVNGAGVGSRAVAGWLYRNIDQQVVDGIINGSGVGAEESGQFLRRIQTGRVQQYGALLFGGAVILAGVLVLTA